MHFCLVATAHGVHGLVVIADDYIASARAEIAAVEHCALYHDQHCLIHDLYNDTVIGLVHSSGLHQE